MVSKSTIESRSQEFIEANLQEFAGLSAFIQLSENFTLGFIEISFASEEKILIEKLKGDPKFKDIQFTLFNFSNDRELNFLLDEIINKLKFILPEEDKKLVIFVQGLEKFIHDNEDYPPILQNLNFVRNAYREKVPHPILFVLPTHYLNRLAQFAPDFWDWRSGVFQFQSTTPAEKQILESSPVSFVANSAEVAGKIDRLEQSCNEFHCFQEPASTSAKNNCGDILYQLGSAYLQQNKFKHAKQYLDKSLEFAQARNDRNLQADIRKALSHLNKLVGSDFSTFIDRILIKKHGLGTIIHKLKAKDSTGRWAYYFVAVPPYGEKKFLDALDSAGQIDLEDYGRVIASCYGESPSETIKKFLKEEYGFNV